MQQIFAYVVSPHSYSEYFIRPISTTGRATIVRMDALFITAHVLFGFIIGSFVNVLVLRHSTGRSTNGRSGCMSCCKKLHWYELIPVLSFFVQGRRCSKCGSRVSVQYPIVETVTGLLFGLVAFAGLHFVQHLIALAIVAILVAIAAYDILHTIIPNPWVFVFGILALVYTFLTPTFNFQLSTFNLIVAGPLVALPLFALWFVSDGRWMGLGDAKLTLGIGWLLGIANGFVALGLSFIIGAVVGVALIGISRFVRGYAHITIKSEIPFGPFLILGMFIVWFSGMFGVEITSFLVL